MQTDVGAALRECEQRLGAEHVISDSAAVGRYTQNVSGLTRRVPAVLRPGSAAEVQAIVQIANRHHLPLYPISRGRNWGMGSKLPVADGCAIVDLGRMNRIHEINAEFHYAVIEPGVTQGQLCDALRERNLPMILNVTGSSRDSSVLGNSLERGVGYFASRANCLSGLEVVLGTGEILRTGFGHMDGAKTTHLYKHGIGPSLDGLFFQSNFGIVTRAGVDLIPWRAGHESALIKINDAALLPRLVQAMGDLRQREIVRMIVHIGNRARTIGTLAPLVYRNLPAAQKADAARARRTAEDLLAQEGFGVWSAIAGFSGTPAQRAAARREINAAVRGFASVTFLSDARIGMARKILGALQFLPGARRKRMILEAMAPIHGLSNGVPTDAAMPSVYWAAGQVAEERPDLDPDQGDCGMLYSLPMIPLDGPAVVEAVAFVDSVFAKYGLVPMTTLNIMDERCVELVNSIPFRRDDAKQVESAHACLDELQRGWLKRGFCPYRLGVQEMGLVVREGDVFWQTVKGLKKVFDPNNVIAPGRYNLI